MINIVICALLTAQQASGLIYRLNASEYSRLPELFALDRFSPCLLAPGDTYCYVDAKLAANKTSQLLTLIQDYSAYSRTHFDHTLVHRGLCVTQTCRDHLTTDLIHSIEACLNATLYRTYGLQARVIKNKVWCTKYDEPAGYDALDYATALLGLVLLMLNVASSILDHFLQGQNNLVGRLLACFSVRRNWRRLRMASGEGPEPRLAKLKCFTGIKTITTVLVIMAHSPLNCIIATNNPEYVENVSVANVMYQLIKTYLQKNLTENVYYNVLATFVLNGTLIIQTFFVISGFLLAYNMLLLDEKRKISWVMLPKGIVFRWLRLVPVNAVVLAFVATWQRHLGSGPLWKSVVEVETLQCRRDWFYNLLYVNNYMDNSDCLPHTWYLGADMQLSVVGLVIFCLATSPKVREKAVAVAFVVGLVTPAIHTYLQDLSPIVVVAPEVVRNLFVEDPTFNNVYKRSHTNLVCYAIGMALALLIYRLQKQKFNVEKYKKYRPLYWSIVPIGVLLIMSGVVLYIDGVQFPLAVRAVYSSAIKLAYGLSFAVLIGGAIFEFEDVYRGLLEWSGWALLGRLSYAAYIVHITVIRTAIGASAALAHNSFNQITLSFLGVLCLSYLIAVPLWMMVEAPFGELVKVCCYPDEDDENNKPVPLTTETYLENKETVVVKL